MPYLTITRSWSTPVTSYRESKTFFYVWDKAEAHAAAAAESRGAEGWAEEHYVTVSGTMLSVLVTFAKIVANGPFYLRAGYAQSVLNGRQSVLAVATLPDEWLRDTRLSNHYQLLNVLCASKRPVIDFREDALIVQSTGVNVTFPYEIEAPLPLLQPSRADPAVECHISADEQRRLIKAMHTCQCLQLIADVQSERGGDDHVELRAHSASAEVQMSMPCSVHDPTLARAFRFSTADIELLPEGGFTILLGDWKYGVWIHDTLPMVFFVAATTLIG